MGHRNIFSTSQMLEGEPAQNWNYLLIEQPYINMVRAGFADNGFFFYPAEIMSVDGVLFAPQWHPTPITYAYVSSNHGVEISHYQPDASGPSHGSFLLSSSAGASCAVPENHTQHASSSNYDGQTFYGAEGGLVDLTLGNVRGRHKRKSPGVPSAREESGTSRFYAAGSSSDPPLSSELGPEEPNLDPQYMACECITMNPGHRGNTSIRPESAIRNVGHRPALDLELSLARTHSSSNSSHNSYPDSDSFDHSGSVDFLGQNSSVLTHDWSRTRMCPASGRMLASGASGYNHEPNQFLVGSSISNAAVDIRGYHHNFIPSTNPVVSQSSHGASAHSIRGVCSSFTQRPTPTLRASSSSLRLGHAASSDDGVQLVAENSSSRQPRLLPAVSRRNSDRNRRSRIAYERYVSLDIDNMSYEELLALGERIGSVSTGLSEDQISKSLTKTVYCSSGQNQDEGICVICLEEYKDMDDVGLLKICGHDYHVSCIKKWLSMKNLCPICKGSAVPDNMKE